MAEYWKSSGNYYCKFCEVFVRDTKFERNRHETSGRHQNAISKQLREAHKTKEREEREKKKVQAELARLNKVTGGSSSAAEQPKPALTSEELPWKRKAHTFADDQPHRAATAEDRRVQAQQLAQLGVDVPQNFANPVAAPGEWQTVSITTELVLDDEEDGDEVEEGSKEARGIKKEESDDEEKPSKIPESASDPADNQDEEFSVPTKRKKRVEQLAEDDLDDLFGGVAKKSKRELKDEDDPAAKNGDALNDGEQAKLRTEEPEKKKNRAFSRLGGTTAPITFRKRKPNGAPPMDVLG